MIDPRTADELASIAAQLAVRVRDDDPQANARWLRAVLPDPGDWFRLAFVLAAAVPDDRPWLQLTAWTVAPATGRDPAGLSPHGTYAAAQRHRRRGQVPCEPCWEAEREYRRQLYATRKAIRRAA